VAVTLAGTALGMRREAEQLRGEEPRLTVAGTRSYDFALEVMVAVDTPPPTGLTAQRSGVVTAMALDVGQAPPQGSVAFRIEDRPVIAFIADAPLYRDIGPGVEGPDVQRLSGYLVELGFLEEGAATSVFTPSLGAAIRAFRAEHGLPIDTRFEYADVVFVPRDVVEVSHVDLRAGERAESGSAVAHAELQPRRVALLPASPDASLRELESAPVRIDAAGELTTIPALGLQGADGTRLARWLRAQAESGRATLTERAGGFDAGGLIASLATARRTTIVPLTALHVGPSGRTCVFVERDGALTTTALSRAELLRSEPGMAAVDDGLAGAAVVTDATAAPPDAVGSCE
jgi:peptidoglycan hydrolase-like protein with peptidoglycan-binding domain